MPCATFIYLSANQINEPDKMYCSNKERHFQKGAPSVERLEKLLQPLLPLCTLLLGCSDSSLQEKRIEVRSNIIVIDTLLPLQEIYYQIGERGG